MNTTVLIVLAVLAYTLFAFCNARTGGRIDAVLSSVVLNGAAAVVSVIVYLVWLYLRGGPALATRVSGIAYAAVAGVSVVAFTILIISIYGRGGHLSYVFPVVYGASIALGAVVGFLFLGDPVSPLRIVGVAAVVVGLTLLAVA